MRPDDGPLAALAALATRMRRRGARVEPARVALAARALERVGLDDAGTLRRTLRLTLAASPHDRAAFDAAWAAWCAGAEGDAEAAHEEPASADDERAAAARPAPEAPAPGGDAAPSARTDTRPAPEAAAPADDGDPAAPGTPGASALERLRRADLAALDPRERAAAERLAAQLAPRLPRRPGHRLAPAPRGARVDLAATARRALANGGELVELRRARRAPVPQPIVVLADVSGSMAPYARALLLALHALVRSSRAVEAFLLATRLTRVTPELCRRPAERAVADAGARAADWSGGTRLGPALAELNARWVPRGVGRGATVAILSDGLERGDPALLEHELARLARSARLLVWANPLAGRDGYEPLARGMRRALPHVDRFLPAHSVDALAGVLALVTEPPARARPPAGRA